MDTIAAIRQKARSQRKKVILPEYDDRRVQDAFRIIKEQGIADVLLLSPDYIDAQENERYIQEFYEMRKHKGVLVEMVRQLFSDPLYHAAMMTREGKVDGLVAGATHTTPDMARAAIYCLGVDARIGIACGAFIMVVPHSLYGESGTFVFADCGIVPDPDPQQLASIAVVSAELASKVLNIVPRVALLSYSTHGSAQGREIREMNETLEVIKKMSPDLLVDGELQADAAIVPEVARIKCVKSAVAGCANVLIFPDLEAGNISYKLVERLGKARALGPLLLGLNKPCSDLSRGCSVEDIVDCVAVTAIRAQ